MNCINDCMYKGPALQPNIWDIMIRARMAPCLLVGDLKQPFYKLVLNWKTVMPSGFYSP